MSRHKRKVFEELIDEIRRSQNATDRFDQAVADALGLNRTDMRCLDFLQREGPVTAGRLAEATGLTTGAMTTALDRLERAGYARRTRDATDRRRVLVETTAQLAHDAGRYYGPHAELSERLYQRYSEQQLELLLEFTREGREFNEQHAAEVEQQNRAQPSPPASSDSVETPPAHAEVAGNVSPSARAWPRPNASQAPQLVRQRHGRSLAASRRSARQRRFGVKLRMASSRA